MKHSISLYDTGKANSYTRRNEGFVMASVIVGLVMAISGIVMTMAGLFDPAVPGGVAIAGIAILLAPMVNGMMFLAHRNFGLGERATSAMDAIYSLPKEERKQYNITRDDVEMLTSDEAYDLENAIAEYRRNRSTGNAVGTLIANITEYNKTAREIEGMH